MNLISGNSPTDSSGCIRVLGIDPGSDVTGYGVVESEGSRCRLIECSAIHTSARTPFADRLVIISQRIEQVIQTLRPDVCSIEEPFYAVNVKSALKLGRVLGALTLTAQRAGVPVFEYSPLQIKSALVGYGRAEKGQVREMVRVLLNLEQMPQSLDVSDALAAAICHIHTASTRQKVAKAMDVPARRRASGR